MTEALPAAVLWDMDGTLVDTEPYWMAAEHALVEAYGGVWTDEHAHQLVGNDLMVSAEYLRAHSPIDLTPLEIVRELLASVVASVKEHVPWRPGARELRRGRALGPTRPAHARAQAGSRALELALRHSHCRVPKRRSQPC